MPSLVQKLGRAKVTYTKSLALNTLLVIYCTSIRSRDVEEYLML